MSCFISKPARAALDRMAKRRKQTLQVVLSEALLLADRIEKEKEPAQ